MQDVYLPIAHALARPLRTPSRSGVWLHQVWRADFAALARLALVGKDAADAVRRLLWALTKLGERERARRAQVERAHVFIRRAAPLIASVSWTRAWSGSKDYVHLRSVTTVAFNGRLRIREYYFPGRRKRFVMAQLGYDAAVPLRFGVGLTLTRAEPDRGRILILTGLLKSHIDVWTGAFTNHDGALSLLRYFTFMGREHWERIQPEQALQRFERYLLPMEPNLNFELIAAGGHA
jgi:hypothetical protein